MSNYTTLKSTISTNIKQNGNKAITGALFQSVLLAMVNSLGSKFQFAGVATPSMNPGTPDYNVAYIAGPGTYANFGNKTVPSTYLGILKYNGTWAIELIQLPGDSYFETLNNVVSLKQAYTGGITTPQGDITAPAGVVFGKSSGKITVGSNGDFNSLSAALSYASKYSRVFTNNGTGVEVEIQAGFVVNEAIEINGVDLSFVRITRAGYTPLLPTVANRRAYLNGTITISDTVEIGTSFSFAVRNGASGPRISCIFEYKGNISTAPSGFTIENGSSLVIDGFCGIRNCAFGVSLTGASRLSAKGALIKYSYDRPGITADYASFADLSNSIITTYGDDNLADASNSSFITLNGAIVGPESNNASVGLYAEYCGVIDASSLEIYNFTDINLSSYSGSKISIGCFGAQITCEILYGGIIQVTEGTAVPASGTINTLSANGIIFA